MKKTAILLGIGFVLMVGTVMAAGSAFQSFADSIDTTNGTVGCAYRADK